MRQLLRVLPAALLLASVAGCGDGDPAGEATPTTTTETVAPADEEPSLDGTITVFAAASLTDAFDALADAFTGENPGVTVELSFGASSALREQILEGAPADVFASANASNMDQVIDAGEVAASQVFVTNVLQIAVPKGNPAGVTGLESFADEDLLIGLCAEEVPCGDFGRQVLDAAGVVPSVDTNELDVRALLGKVEAGELDAGLVYASDVVSAGDEVDGIDVPDDIDVVAEYPIGAVESSEEREVADAFIAFVLSDEGQAILQDFGFGRPA